MFLRPCSQLNHLKYKNIVKKKDTPQETQQNPISTMENAMPSGKQTATTQGYEKRKAFAQCDLINGYLGKQNQKL